MGYSRNPVTLRKIEARLEPLTRGTPCSWTITEGSADRWAYRVREALSIALRHPEKFPGLARHARRIRVEVVNDHLVQALIDDSERAPEAVLNEPSTVPIHGLAEAAGPGASRTLVSPRSAAEVIEFFIRSGASNDPIRILQADLSDDQKAELQKYAQSRTPAWVLLEPAPGALVFTPSTPDLPPGAIWQRRNEPRQPIPQSQDVASLGLAGFKSTSKEP